MYGNVLLRFVTHDTEGATAIEYALILALICLGAAGAISVLGDSVDGTLFGPVNADFANAANGN